MPTFSIVVPSYNHGRFLGQCIKSVLAQTYVDWQLIIVDDCSSDNSLEVARSFEDPRIQVHSNGDNIGTYGTLNRAMDIARGEYIAILNSDDFWDPTKLQKQIETIRKHTPESHKFDTSILQSFSSSVPGGSKALGTSKNAWSLCYTLGGWVDDRSGAVIRSGHEDWPTHQVQDLLPFLLEKNLLLASSVVFRRESLVFDFTLRFSGDWVAALKLAAAGPALCVPENLTFWRQHEDNSYTKAIKVRIEEIRVRQAIVDRWKFWLAVTGQPEAVYAALGRCALHLHALYVLFGDEKKAKKALSDAAEMDKRAPGLAKRRLLNLLPLAAQQQKLWPKEKAGAYRAEYIDRPVEPAPL